MSLPKISLTMRTEGGVQHEELHAAAGTAIEIDLSEDTGAGIGFDYTSANELKLRIEGRVKVNVLNTSAAVHGAVLQDMETKEIEFNGGLELQINKDIAASLTTSLNPDETIVGTKIKIAF